MGAGLGQLGNSSTASGSQEACTLDSREFIRELLLWTFSSNAFLNPFSSYSSFPRLKLHVISFF